MASIVNAALCALVAAAFYTAFGYAVGRHLLPRVLALGMAPVFGWAVVSATSLPVLTLLRFSPATVAGLAALFLVIAAGALITASADGEPASQPAVPLWCFPAAGLLALVPASAILPKFSAGGVHLADPIFDHAKIAAIDAMMRQGLPPIDPVFGAVGGSARLAYYYLWHFSAAELAMPLRISGWEADIALTWFTALASLMAMMGIAVWLSQRSGAAIWVVALAAATSLRQTLSFIFGSYALAPFMATPTGFAGWLFQSAWVPQHLMAATCVIAALVLIVHYAERPSAARFVVLVLTVVAGFESSSYVGGLTLAAAIAVAAPILFGAVRPVRRVAVAGGLAGAAALALLIAAPFIRDQLAAVAARGDGTPVVVDHFAVLGDLFSPALRRALDWPGYWVLLLPIEFPAAFIAGLIGLVGMERTLPAGPQKTATAMFIGLAGAGLVMSWLVVSTVGDNNDLGLRAVLPAAMILIVGAAAGMMRAPNRLLIAVLALGGLVLSLPDTAVMIRSNVVGTTTANAQTFAEAPAMWAAVRRYAAPTARVANDPLYLQDVTPWPVNVSWALLANRSSCFAGREMALAFAPLPPDRREAINAQFIRVFAGQGTPADVEDMSNKYSCDVVVVVPQDGAWNHDPFAASADYRLAESRNGKWRIYVRNAR
ncbi:MAG TPA: hypothetical protein VHX43_11130 [Xanthobacteraceae bacterium]|jgi:hypothetical protein|nr:hypothetical protein [Xanthobacteraceae bacterium]